MPIVVVTTAAENTRLATLAALKAELGITTGDDDERLAAYLDQASDAIAKYTNRRLATEGVVETFRGADLPRDEVLQLSRYPVQSIASVVVDGETMDAGAYTCDTGTGLLYRLGTDDDLKYWDAANKIVVTYTAGYVLPGEANRTLPYDIERACLDIAKATRFSTQRDPALKEFEVPGVLREVYWVGAAGSEVAGIPGQVASALNPYRNMVV